MKSATTKKLLPWFPLLPSPSFSRPTLLLHHSVNSPTTSHSLVTFLCTPPPFLTTPLLCSPSPHTSFTAIPLHLYLLTSLLSFLLFHLYLCESYTSPHPSSASPPSHPSLGVSHSLTRTHIFIPSLPAAIQARNSISVSLAISLARGRQEISQRENTPSP